jgi:hypothetical protein
MRTLFNKFKTLFLKPSRVNGVERVVKDYLDKSIDIVDLKRRMEILKSKGIL